MPPVYRRGRLYAQDFNPPQMRLLTHYATQEGLPSFLRYGIIKNKPHIIIYKKRGQLKGNHSQEPRDPRNNDFMLLGFLFFMLIFFVFD